MQLQTWFHIDQKESNRFVWKSERFLQHLHNTDQAEDTLILTINFLNEPKEPLISGTFKRLHVLYALSTPAGARKLRIVLLSFTFLNALDLRPIASCTIGAGFEGIALVSVAFQVLLL